MRKAFLIIILILWIALLSCVASFHEIKRLELIDWSPQSYYVIGERVNLYDTDARLRVIYEHETHEFALEHEAVMVFGDGVTHEDDGLFMNTQEAGEYIIRIVMDNAALHIVYQVGSMPDYILQEGESIQSALNQALCGEWIHVEAGIYEEDLAITKNVTLTSDGATVIAQQGKDSTKSPFAPHITIEGDAALTKTHAFTTTQDNEIVPIQSSIGLFGALPKDDNWLVEASFALPEPLFADSALEDADGDILVVRRGKATFETIAQRAEEANASAVAIVNTSDELNIMPFQSAFVDIPVVMIKHSVGEALIDDLQNGETIKGRFLENPYKEVHGVHISGFTFKGVMPEITPFALDSLNGPFGSSDDQGLTSHAIRVDDNQTRTNITIKDNIFYYTGGIYINNVHHASLENNVFVRDTLSIPLYPNGVSTIDKPYGGSIIDLHYTSNITLQGNTGFAPSAFGVILVRNSQLINVKENIIDAEGFDETCSEHAGIHVRSSHDIKIESNTIKGHHVCDETHGIHLFRSEATITNNIIAYNTNGLYSVLSSYETGVLNTNSFYNNTINHKKHD